MKNGPYEMVKAPDDYPGKKYRGRYCYEHQLVWWQETGELAPDDHVIHHKTDDTRDNGFENLELKTRASHTLDHCKVKPIKIPCGWCDKKLELAPADYRRRVKVAKTDDLYCSRACGMSASWRRRNQNNLR